MLGLIKNIFKKIDNAADYLADFIVSTPEANKDNSDAEAIKLTAGGAAGAAASTGILSAAIAGTEALSAAGAGTALVQTGATIAAAATEVSAVATGASTVGTSATAIAGSGSIPLVAATAGVLFLSYTAAKVGYRAAGHAYNSVLGKDRNLGIAKELGIDKPKTGLTKPKLTA